MSHNLALTTKSTSFDLARLQLSIYYFTDFIWSYNATRLPYHEGLGSKTSYMFSGFCLQTRTKWSTRAYMKLPLMPVWSRGRISCQPRLPSGYQTLHTCHQGRQNVFSNLHSVSNFSLLSFFTGWNSTQYDWTQTLWHAKVTFTDWHWNSQFAEIPPPAISGWLGSFQGWYICNY